MYDMLLLNLIQVTESISGSDVPLAMFNKRLKVLIFSLKGLRVIETSAADHQDSVDRLTLLIIKVHFISLFSASLHANMGYAREYLSNC